MSYWLVATSIAKFLTDVGWLIFFFVEMSKVTDYGAHIFWTALAYTIVYGVELALLLYLPQLYLNYSKKTRDIHRAYSSVEQYVDVMWYNWTMLGLYGWMLLVLWVYYGRHHVESVALVYENFIGGVGTMVSMLLLILDMVGIYIFMDRARSVSKKLFNKSRASTQNGAGGSVILPYNPSPIDRKIK